MAVQKSTAKAKTMKRRRSTLEERAKSREINRQVEADLVKLIARLVHDPDVSHDVRDFFSEYLPKEEDLRPAYRADE